MELCLNHMTEIDAGQLPAENPRNVSRGLKLQSCFFGIDSLYLIMEYPHADIYEFWLEVIGGNLQDANLHQGVDYEEFVIRVGGNGYSLSVWEGDVRLYMTHQVNDKLADTPRAGQGMGLMLQLGPQWLAKYGDISNFKQFRENIRAQFSVYGVRREPAYPIRINRLDFALDILAIPFTEFSTDVWRECWVGYASKMNFHTNGENIQGLSIGSSQGAVRFKIYDKTQEVIANNKLNFWLSVWDISFTEAINVTRFEWTIKPYHANFSDVQYLHEATQEKFFALLNYASLKWGRLCIPNPEDDNRSRWNLAPLWIALQNTLADHTNNYEGLAKRDYHQAPDISEHFIASVSGSLASLQAKIALEEGKTEPVSLPECFEYLAKRGKTSGVMNDKAQKKYKRLLKLVESTALYEE